VWAFALLSALAMSPASAHELRVRWEAPDGCPASSVVVAEIERLLREADPTSLALDAEVVSEESGYRMRFTIRTAGAEDTRSLESSSCDTLGNAAALLAALAVDPTIMDDEEAPPVPRETVELVGELGDPSFVPPAVEAEAITVEVVARALVDFGTMPAIAAGAGLGASIGTNLRGELSLGLYPERFAPLPGSSTVGGELTLATASLDAVWRAYDEWISIAPRAGIEVGLFFGRGTGVSMPDSAVAPAVLLDLGLEIALAAAKPFVASVGGAFLIGLFRPRFQLDNVGEVHRMAPVTGRLWISMGLEIP
jgi:hypothetical protein